MQTKRKTTFNQKIFLVLFGLFWGVLGLELFLRTGGWIFLRLQERANQAAIVLGGEYRILCVGESTTALGGKNAYPRLLEQVLNSRQDKVKVSVINKGVPATNSLYIAANLRKQIENYAPHMVVVMMGINDTNDFIGLRVHPENRFLRASKQLRVYKLFSLLSQHVFQKGQELKEEKLQSKLKEVEQKVFERPTSRSLRELAALYRATYQPEEEFRVLQYAVRLNDQDPNIYFDIAFNYKKKGECEKAIPFFWKGISFLSPGDPDYVGSYIFLAECLKLVGYYEEAEKSYLHAIQVAGDEARAAYATLGDMYLDQGRVQEAKKLFEKELQISPERVYVYGMLAYCYRQEGDKARAEAVIKKGIDLNPTRIEVYRELATFYLEEGRYQEAEKVLRNALGLRQEDEQGLITDVYRTLVRVYEAMGNKEMLHQARASLRALEGQVNALTAENYKKVYEIVMEHNIPLVAVQYPNLPVSSLRDMLPDDGRVIFVDNERSFREGVLQEGFDAYFTDRFAGDFGHCTPKGNHLIASNIADAILSRFPLR